MWESCSRALHLVTFRASQPSIRASQPSIHNVPPLSLEELGQDLRDKIATSFDERTRSQVLQVAKSFENTPRFRITRRCSQPFTDQTKFIEQHSGKIELNLEGCIKSHEGPIFDALLTTILPTPELETLNLADNSIGDEGMSAIVNALKHSTVSKLASLDVCNNNIGPKGAQALADWLAVSASLTSLNLSHNNLMSSFTCKGEVEGDSYTVGARVVFEGHEYTVLSAETDDDYPQLGDFSGIKAISDALRVSASLTSKTVREIDLSGSRLTGGNIGGVAGAKHIAEMLKANASLTKILVSYNKLDDEGATILCDALRKSKVTKVRELDLSMNGIGPEGAKGVAAMAYVASVTKILVGYNRLCNKGATLLCNALRKSTVSKVQELDLRDNGIGPQGGMAVAAMAAVVTSLTSLIIYSNQIGNLGIGAIAKALKDSTVSQLASLDVRNNQIGPKGAEALAAWLAVSASLTVTDMRYNHLDTNSATMLANVAKEKGISLCGIAPEQTEADFTPIKNDYKIMYVADAILLTADLAVRASMTRLDVRYNSRMGEEGKAVLREAIEGRSAFELLL